MCFSMFFSLPQRVDLYLEHGRMQESEEEEEEDDEEEEEEDFQRKMAS